VSLNVPAVSDVFLRPIRKNAQRFYGRKKMWRSKTHKGRKPDWVLRSLAALAAYTYRPVMRSVGVHYYNLFSSGTFFIILFKYINPSFDILLVNNLSLYTNTIVLQSVLNCISKIKLLFLQ